MADTGSANEGWASWAVQEELKKVTVNLSHAGSSSTVLADSRIAQKPLEILLVGDRDLGSVASLINR